MTRRWYRAPVVHFVLLGGLLFGAERAWHAARRDGGPPAASAAKAARQVREDLEQRWGYPPTRAEREAEARRERPPIVLSAQRLRQIQEAFVQQYGEPPSRAQLEGLVQQAVDEELLDREARWLALDLGDRGIRQRLVAKMRAVSRDQSLGEAELYRQALDLGLDDDVAVRQHLREKMRLLLQADPAERPPTDAELAACLERHRERFLQPTAVDFTHVFVRAAVDPDTLAERAAEMAERLREEHLSPEEGAELSDSFPLATHWEGLDRNAIARHFGDEFAGAVLALPPGAWSAPIASPFGLHLVWVHARHSERTPPVDSIRGQLVQLVVEERAAARLAAGLDRLRHLYQIRIEWPQKVAAAGAPATEARR
jgi:parvulin-like peptidyl-prolyl cis-trans isomerase-like protein